MTKTERVSLGLSALSLAVACWCASQVSGARSHPPVGRGEVMPVAAREAETAEARLKKLEAASSGLGEKMCGIQAHFAKLYFAAQARNWDLARFEQGEVEEGLEKITLLRPQENGVNLSGIADAFKQTQLEALKDAIEMKDRTMFRDAYQQSILMCNTCHQSSGRPFLVITTPTNPPVTNQRWDPLPNTQ